MRFIRTILFVLCACALNASPVLFSIGADDNGVMRRLTMFDVASSTATPVFDLGDGSVAFTGLTYDPGPGTFFAVKNDSFGNSTLSYFAIAGGGTYTDLMSLSSGGTLAFNGLVQDPFDPLKFKAIGNDISPDSELYGLNTFGGTIDQLTVRLGPGYLGGITYDPFDGFFYAIRLDPFGSSTLMRFDLSGSPGTAVATLSDFGVGYYGGLFPAGGGSFYALSTDSFGASTLDLIAPNGTVTPEMAAGLGFYGAGLTSGPGGTTPTPEPSTLVMMMVGGVLLGAARLRRLVRGA